MKQFLRERERERAIRVVNDNRHMKTTSSRTQKIKLSNSNVFMNEKNISSFKSEWNQAWLHLL